MAGDLLKALRYTTSHGGLHVRWRKGSSRRGSLLWCVRGASGDHRMNQVRKINAQILRHRWAWVLFVLILAWRLFQVRTLALPAWVDSVHHTLLLRILLEQGQIPDTWAPYL